MKILLLIFVIVGLLKTAVAEEKKHVTREGVKSKTSEPAGT
jgi:hypothetical protein